MQTSTGINGYISGKRILPQYCFVSNKHRINNNR